MDAWHLARCAVVAVAAAPALAQDAPQAALVTLEMRVTAGEPGRAVVDRGAADGLAAGDRVLFRPRDGALRLGTVERADERSATVVTDDARFAAQPGMRAEARIPGARLTPAVPAGDAAADASGAPEPAAPAHPAWQRQDDGWTPDEPLLARVRPFRPEERAPELRGSVWAGFDGAWSSEDGHSDTLVRAGVRTVLQNPFHTGGRMQADVEWIRTAVDVPDDDATETTVRVDRLSYARGGDRFSPTRFEVGRFLPVALPELGTLDGAEWSQRTAGGDSFGASAGLLPEWDTLEEHGDDQALALWYRWVRDESEELSFTAAYQKTFHDLAADRDLVVAKALWLPRGGWELQATTWVDLYTAGDEAKGAGLGLTQAWVSTGRRWEGGSDLRLSWRHQEFPETDREEFLPVTAEQLADDHLDRVALQARQQMDDFGVRETLGGWVDEDDEGYDGELVVDLRDVLVTGGFVEAAGFGVEGSFTTAAGWRAALGRRTPRGGWRVGYEFVADRQHGFSSGNDDLPMHRGTLALDWATAAGWSLSLQGDALLYDEETGWTAGVYLQRRF